MAVFVTSTSQARRHGVYAIERMPPATVRATGTGTAVLIDQLPWGPAQTLTYPGDVGTMINTFAPPGFVRTGQGYLALIRKSFPRIGIVRVLGSSAVAAFAHLPDITPTNIVKVTLKYPGTSGNVVTWQVSAADDGNSNHFNLTVSITGVTGTTTDIVHNLNYSGTGADSVPDLSQALLIGSILKEAAGRPINASGTFGSGTDGTIDATSYVGTAGANDKGVALLEGDSSVDHVFTGDPGNTLRAAVNAGLMAHADLMTDRVVYINGNSGITASAAQTDVASYRSTRVVYCYPWCYINDDSTGAKTLVPSAPFAASVASNLSPSTSIAWKSDEVQALLAGVVDLEFQIGDNAATNSDQGIVTMITEPTGGTTFESGVVTIAPSNPAKRNLTRTRMGHYIARSVVNSLRPYTDSPNVLSNQQDEVEAVDTFMAGLKANVKLDANHLPHVVDYSIDDLRAANSASSIAQGQFFIPLSAQTSSAQEKIFLLFQYGETVSVSTQL